MDPSSALFLLLVLLFAAAPAVYLAGRVSLPLFKGQALLSRWLALAVLLTAWVPLAAAGQGVLAGQGVVRQLGQVALAMDGLGLFLAVTVLLLATVVCLYSIPYLAGEENEEKYYAMLLMLAAAMIGLGCARDLFNLWVWFETMTITTFLLVAFYRGQPGALEAGVKYLVQSAVGSLLVLFGIALVFGQTGTLDLAGLRPALHGSGSLALAAGALFLAGFGVKAALVPMHTWLPDAHSQAPSGISALLSGVVIECGLVALLRVIGPLMGTSSTWGALVLGFGALNLLAGNLLALRQTEVKRLLAYSSVAQVGYMLIGFGTAIAFGLPDGAAGGFFHLFNHAVLKGLAFLAAGVLLYGIHRSHGSHGPLVLEDLDGAARRYPLPALVLSVAVLGLGGLPPLSGFASKWQIFAGGVEVRSTPLLLLVVFAGLNSVLSLGYYAPLVNRLYRRSPSAGVQAGSPAPRLFALPLLALGILAVLPGVWPTLLSWLTGPAAASLLAGLGY